jgi:hypothetical protein
MMRVDRLNHFLNEHHIGTPFGWEWHPGDDDDSVPFRYELTGYQFAHNGGNPLISIPLKGNGKTLCTPNQPNLLHHPLIIRKGVYRHAGAVTRNGPRSRSRSRQTGYRFSTDLFGNVECIEGDRLRN